MKTVTLTFKREVSYEKHFTITDEQEADLKQHHGGDISLYKNPELFYLLESAATEANIFDAASKFTDVCIEDDD